MTVPQAFLDAVQSNEVTVGYWMEIEGLPYGYGNFTEAAGFFAARVLAKDKLLGIVPALSGMPQGVDYTLDVLDGGAQSAGLVDFLFTDIDGTLTQLVGIGYQTGFVVLSAAMAVGDTTIHFLGSAASFSAGGYVYIGTETIKIGAIVGQTFTGCTRAMFRSTAQAFGVGAPLGTRPYTVSNRRCWFNEVAAKGNGTSLDDREPYTVIRMAGLANNLVFDTSKGYYTLTVVSSDFEINRNAFRSIRSLNTVVTVMGPDGTSGTVTAPGWPAFQTPAFLGDGNATGFTDNENFLARINNEIFLLSVDSHSFTGKTYFFIQARALFGTKAESHGASIAQEVIPMVAKDATGTPAMEQISKFSAVPISSTSGVKADHPLALILQVLCSGQNGSNGAYDVLPTEWGMNRDISRVDIAGIEKLMLEEPTIRFGGLIDEPINCIKFIREMLAFCGYYYFIATGDIFTIKRVRPPAPDEENPTFVTNADRIRNFPVQWLANWSGAVSEIVFKYGWDILLQDYLRIEIFELPGAQLYAKGQARALTFESKFLYPGASGINGEPPIIAMNVHEWLRTRADLMNLRYGRPPPIMQDNLNYGFLSLEPGQLLAVTHANLPDVETGAMGFSGQIGEVTLRNIDDTSKTVAVSMLMTGYSLGHYRMIAPSVQIVSVTPHAGPHTTDAVLELNKFTAPGGQTDLEFLGAATTLGSTYGAFGINNSPDYLRVWKADFTASFTCCMTVVTDSSHITLHSNTINIDSPPFTLVGAYITFDSFATDGFSYDKDESDFLQNLESYGLYAFAADANDKLDTTDPPHLMFPT